MHLAWHTIPTYGVYRNWTWAGGYPHQYPKIEKSPFPHGEEASCLLLWCVIQMVLNYFFDESSDWHTACWCRILDTSILIFLDSERYHAKLFRSVSPHICRPTFCHCLASLKIICDICYSVSILPFRFFSIVRGDVNDVAVVAVFSNLFKKRLT